MEYLWVFDADLYNQMLRFPAEIVPLFEQIVYAKFQEIVMGEQGEKKRGKKPYIFRSIRRTNDCSKN